MSEENVENLRAALEAWDPETWKRAEGPLWEAGLVIVDPEVTYEDTIRFELDEVVEVEEGLLLADNVGYVQGREGIEAQARSAWLITTGGARSPR